MNSSKKINLGCSVSPTKGWINLDNSPGIILARFGVLSNLLFKLKVISDDQFNIVKFYKKNKIQWVDATKKIPFSSNSIDAIYSSHMLEHLDRADASKCLKEIYRVLKPNGIIRLALPNIRQYVEDYIKDKNADKLIESSFMGTVKPKKMHEKIINFISGPRHHLWMYDEKSLSMLLINHSFQNPQVLDAGQTTIKDYGNLDLNERSNDSFYMEAIKPNKEA